MVLSRPGSPPGKQRGWQDSPFLMEFMADIFAVTRQALLGFDLEVVDVERAALGVLRVTIDRPGGVTIDDCEQASHQLSRAFEVENVDYKRLEVSSPGVDRPLKRREDFVRFAGQRIELRLAEAVGSQRVFTGILQEGADGSSAFCLRYEDQAGQQQILPFSFDDVERAHLDPILDFKGKKR